ncbi:mechanosensitive ion channel family protein [Agaribacter flavus]|uniref:Small-conductance mechanosensitive channel n=1 Tax=Agaribacter flavus TaxID=1902781 RepID=A0ABV7FT68_9ALTE
MRDFSQLAIDTGLALIPFIFTLVCSVFALVLSHKLLFRDKSLNASAKFPRQLSLALVYFVAIIALIISLPVEKETKNQVLGLLGILLSGVIAFSSTALVSNIMSGLVMRITKPFRTGDFIRVGDFFGRVTERSIFDTEIQTEQRELIAFTNSYLLTQPLQVVRSSGTIISANLSLGYDLHHSKIEKLLVSAAENAGLKEPFMQIIELGDFSISYRISGLLEEVKSLISARSRLLAQVLDTLHNANIEIVSPGFINQRRMDDKPPVIAKPPYVHKIDNANEANPEDLIFDKAEAAEKQEFVEQTLSEQIKYLQTQVKQADQVHKERFQKQLEIKLLKLEKLKQDKKTQ